MKFNEKLIELRKKAGFSQEELGYKLNVTRQTVSKWELGQTTPEMDKLLDMSKLFNITVDELINESEIPTNSNPIIEDQTIKKQSNKEKNIKIIIIGAIVIIIVLIVFKLLAGLSIFNKVANTQANTQANIFDKFFGMFGQVTNTITSTAEDEKQQQMANHVFDQITNIASDINETESQITLRKFNGPIEIFSGSQMGGGVIAALDKIVTSNKTQDNKITVKYKTTETQEENEITSIKQNIKKFNNYNISFDYDANGFINKATIETL